MKSLALAGVLLLCGIQPAWAEVTVIYRKADRVVASWVSPPHSVEVEIQNMTQSALGGVVSDYGVAIVSEAVWAGRGDRDVTVDADGTVVFVPNARAEKRKTDRTSAKAKLKALGLTNDEIAALRE